MRVQRYFGLHKDDLREWSETSTEDVLKEASRAAVEWGIERSREFKSLFGLIGTYARKSTERRCAEIQNRIASLPKLTGGDRDRLCALVDERPVLTGRFSVFGLVLQYVAPKDWQRLVHVLIANDPDPVLEEFLLQHRGRVPGLRLAGLSEIATLMRPDLYPVFNRKTMPSVREWLADEQYGRYVRVARVLRRLCDEAQLPPGSRFRLLDFALQGDSRPKREKARAAAVLRSWLHAEWMIESGRIQNFVGRTRTGPGRAAITEGEKVVVKHLRAERATREACLEIIRESLGVLPECCDVCAINPGEVLNELAFALEIHHVIPLKNGRRATRAEDLRLLCPNCHAAAHRSIAIDLAGIGSASDVVWRDEYTRFRKRCRLAVGRG